MDNFTVDQLKAINIVKGNVAVSASAGSGKTRVVIERLIQLIIKGQTDIKNVLCVTYTNLAAEEMRIKLKRAIREQIKLGNNVAAMKKQLDYLPLASISTVHSFCSSVIKKYFYHIGVDPKYRIIEDKEAKVLQQKSIDEVFEKLYDEKNPIILHLVKTVASKRDDKALKKVVVDIFEFVASEKSTEDFFNNAIASYNEKNYKIAENQLIDLFLKKLSFFEAEFKNLYDAIKTVNEKYALFIKEWLVRIEEFKKCKSLNDIKALAASKMSDKPRVSLKNDDYLAQLSKELDVIRSGAVRQIDVFKALQETAEDGLSVEKAIKSGEILKELITVVKLFEQEYAKQKQNANGLDFADLEHKAYQLLQIEEVKKEVAASYNYIFIDEYQDTNGVQDAIFDLLNRNNVFVVGDVKQSIYAFRGCNSAIFEARIQTCEKNEGGYVELKQNFRSSPAVVNAVNKTFTRIMTKETVGIDYASQIMQYGGLYEDYEGKVTIDYLDVEKVKDEKKLGVYGVKKHYSLLSEQDKIGEEALVADLVEEEIGKDFYDVSLKRVRKIEYGDIAILTRSNEKLYEKILAELISRGMPVVGHSKRNVGQYPEIKLVINILENIVYPDDEIALAATLKAVASLTEDELLTIKNKNKGEGFCLACLLYQKTETDLIADKLKNYYTYIKKIRLICEIESADFVLRRILRETGIENKILAMPLGSLRLQRVERLIQSAKDSGQLSVRQFLERIESILKSTTLSVAGGENSVKIMTIHASKGLEFPVVILTELTGAFSSKDKKKEVCLSRNGYAGLKYYDEEKRTVETTLQRECVKYFLSEASIKDEMRLLYVAMTRAQYSLHITTVEPLPEERKLCEIVVANSLIDFLSASDAEYRIHTPSLSVEPLQQRQVLLSEADEKIVKSIKKYLDFSYPFETDTTVGLKRTVTEINKEAENEFAIKPLFGNDYEIIEKREGAEKTGSITTSIEKGNAYHKFLQFASFDEKLVDNELIRLLSQNLITKTELDSLDSDQLKKILSLDIFKSILDFKLYKEQPFITLIPPELAGYQKANDLVLIQGIIDLLAIKDDKAIIIDYKFSNAAKNDLIARYSKQLELYKYAVEKVLKLKVERCAIVNLARLNVIDLAV